MVSMFTLLSNLLLASVTLAIPTASDDLQSEPSVGATTQVWYNPTRAGVFLTDKDESFYAVAATFTIPHPRSDKGSNSIWLGIDGANCNTTTFATGIDVNVDDGKVSFASWAIWYPGPSHHFQNFTLHPGDVISFHVTASSSKTGVAMIENSSTGQFVIQSFSSEYALCRQNVQWYVEDYSVNGTVLPLLDFGTVTFKDALAYGIHRNYEPSSSGATIAAIEQNNKVLTRTTVNGGTITVVHL